MTLSAIIQEIKKQKEYGAKHLVSQEMIEKIAQDPHFRVAIFGSARIKKDDERYQNVFELARRLGEKDMGVVTGGGPGMMEAANAGHNAGHTKGPEHSRSIGLTVDLPFESEGNDHLDIERHFRRFSNRLDTFMLLSQAVVVTPGGVGTCLELFYTWQLTQVRHICSIPIILYGDMWKKLMDWVYDNPMKDGLISPNDDNNVHIAKDIDEVMAILLKYNDVYKREGENFCLNYKKYKLK